MTAFTFFFTSPRASRQHKVLSRNVNHFDDPVRKRECMRIVSATQN